MSDWVKLQVNAQQRKRGVVARRWQPDTGRTQETRFPAQLLKFAPWFAWSDCRKSYTRKPKVVTP